MPVGGVAAGERVLGKEYIENEAGNFWLLINNCDGPQKKQGGGRNHGIYRAGAG